jgi:hypothetical protein
MFGSPPGPFPEDQDPYITGDTLIYPDFDVY